jgi:GNAT superfamily N-acetyltransferase
MHIEIPIDEISKMADVTADAFMDCNDPIGNFIFYHEPEHLKLKRRFFRSLVTTCPPSALRMGMTSEMAAVAIWFPPGMDHSGDEDADPFLESDFQHQETMERLIQVGNVINVLTENLGNEPQWYLHLVAVSPKFMGHRYSSLLVEPILKRADEEGLPCTLITQRLDNVRKYEHWHFEVVKEMQVPGSGEKFYSMRRDTQINSGLK